MNNWFKLSRKIFENEIWLSEPFTKAQAWVDLIGNANHEKGSFFIRGNEVVINRGQIGWSELTMARRWRWSRNKVRRFLKWLETKQQIEQLKDRYLTTIITITNYNNYQNDTADETAERQQTIHKQRRIKKNKEDIYTEKENSSESLPKVEEREKLILSVFSEVMGKKFGAVEKKNVDFWINTDRFTLEEVLQAIKNIPILASQEKTDFWKTMTPVRFFRQRNVNGMTDYIEQALNAKPKQTSPSRESIYASENARLPIRQYGKWTTTLPHYLTMC